MPLPSLSSDKAAALGAKPPDEPGRLTLLEDGFEESGLGHFVGGPPEPSSGFRFSGEAGRSVGFELVALFRGRAARFVCVFERFGSPVSSVSSELKSCTGQSKNVLQEVHAGMDH